MADIRQSVSYAKYLKSQGWIVEKINGTNYFIKKIPILGNILKIQRPKEVRHKDIQVLNDKYKPWYISVEPINQNAESRMRNLGYKLSNSAFLPTKTLRIDLTKSTKQITADFHYRARRGVIRGSSVKIKEYSTPDEIKIFQESWKKSAKFNRYVMTYDELLNFKKSFPQKDTLFVASHNINSRVIGGALFTICREINDIVCYYWQGFTNNEGRALLSHYSLMYYGILWARRRGCKTFDFEGIYDDRFPNKSWLGFTHFKKGFGGYELTYPGCYTKFILKNVFTSHP